MSDSVYGYAAGCAVAGTLALQASQEFEIRRPTQVLLLAAPYDMFAQRAVR
jgi:hypothetical protein